MPATPGPNHDGGKVAIGPDANVYTVIGDLNRRTQAQNVETGASPDGTGGILRVTRDGSTVGSGIQGSSSPLNKYFAYGVRNSFGLDFDPVSSKLWDSENGPGSNDEINLVDPGFNSGWIDLMGMAPSGFNFNNLVNFGGKGKYSDPEFVWTQTVAPTAIEFLTSGKLGSSYQNDMFVGDFNKGRIYDFNLNSGRTALSLSGNLADKIANTDAETGQVIFGEGFGGVTDLKVGPGDGYLYVLSIGNGALYKILPKSASTASKSSSDETSDSAKNPSAENKESKKLKQDKDLAKEKKNQKITERVEALRERQLQKDLQEEQQQIQDTSNTDNQTLKKSGIVSYQIFCET